MTDVEFKNPGKAFGEAVTYTPEQKEIADKLIESLVNASLPFESLNDISKVYKRITELLSVLEHDKTSASTMFGGRVCEEGKPQTWNELANAIENTYVSMQLLSVRFIDKPEERAYENIRLAAEELVDSIRTMDPKLAKIHDDFAGPYGIQDVLLKIVTASIANNDPKLDSLVPQA